MVNNKSGVTDGGAGALVDTFDRLDESSQKLERGVGNYARTIAAAFTGAVASGKQFDDVLKSVALRISNMAVQAAIRPAISNVSGGIQDLFGKLFGGIKPFAAGGVVGTPTYFPMSSGGIGLAGEAGPEAILPLARGSDGKLGVTAGGGAGPARISINIATPDAESFRRSEAYITGQIARAVARGQRSL